MKTRIKTTTMSIIASLFAAYFLPTIIVTVRGARHWSAIGLINLFLGWTIFGWIAALIWAITEQREAIQPVMV